MIVYPNAKINLGLAVVRKRTDGYHDLETLFLPVPGLHDELEIKPLERLCQSSVGKEEVGSGLFSFHQKGLAVDCPAEDNLIIRTYLRVREAFPDKVGPVEIRFRKNIPFGAGLGGGSADAAFTLVALNRLFDLGLSDEQMERLISPLGADCAFFIQNRPRFAEGIGDVFSEVPEAVLEQLRGKWLLLVKPDCAVSTRDAYRGIQPRESRESSEGNVEPLTGEGNLSRRGVSYSSVTPCHLLYLRGGVLPLSSWQETLRNDFETTVFPLYPEIAAVKQQLLDMGALYAAMSGSGATVFGLFDHEPDTSAFGALFTHKEHLNY